MRKCSGNNFEEWGFDGIFDIECPHCGHFVEFFKDEITRRCSQCKNIVHNNRGNYGCGQWCSSSSPHTRNICPKFRKSKSRYFGYHI